MYPFFFDWTFLLLIPALGLALYAQAKVKGTYKTFSRVASRRGFTGAEVSRFLMDHSGLGHVQVAKMRGTLTDHYDPRKKVLNLSEGVYGSNSIAALGIAAHEAGHAIQHGLGYSPLVLRNNIVPVANFGSSLAFPLFFVGLFFRIPTFMDIGIVFFSLAVLFHIVTLPVELNASHRALSLLSSEGYLDQEEIGSAKKVLTAAAWTYVAAATMAALQLLRLIVLRGSRD
jgi:Zn-dependent membrane protease YugP